MQINLLPGQIERRRQRLFWQGLKKTLLIFIALWLFLGLFFAFFSFKANAFKKRLSRIDVDWRATEPMLKEREELLKQKKELDEFLVFIKEYFKKGLLWSEKLRLFSRLVPQEVWLSEISLRKDSREGQEVMSLEVSASVSYLKTDEELLDKINSFTEELKGNEEFFKDFQNLSLGEINKAGGSEKAMNFRFSLSGKPSAYGDKTKSNLKE